MTSGVGAKTRSTPASVQMARSASKVRGISGQVLFGPELERVEEDRDDDVGVGLAGPADQGGVPVMQGTHRHDDGDVAVVEGSRASRSSSRVRATTGAAGVAGAAGAAGATPAETVGVGTGPGGSVVTNCPSSSASSSSSASAADALRRPLSRAAARWPGRVRGRSAGCPGPPRGAAPRARQRYRASPRATGPVSARSPCWSVLASAADRSGSSTRDGSSMPASRSSSMAWLTRVTRWLAPCARAAW